MDLTMTRGDTDSQRTGERDFTRTGNLHLCREKPELNDFLTLLLSHYVGILIRA
jgi:hypothetical protein